MTKPMTIKKSLIGLVFFCILLIPPFESLFDKEILGRFGRLDFQLAANYPVIYINIEYSTFIAGGIIALSGAMFMLWQLICLNKGKPPRSSEHYSTKAFATAAIIGFLFIFPGRHIERSHMESLAEQKSYQACPPFTLLMNSVSIDAWVKDFSLCNDPEVDKIAMYGYPDEPAKIAELIAMRNKALTRPQ
ncbi:hypothetical protein M0C34_04720 [Agarivorans sp. TSD2052]|uniref:hypothetical protein n=1 Tax=Agarivorans sp. TSD2052 TaxID=2937286 RepID=UPI00200CBBF0|nr:hypothetical protein [Agarivorans sp. TSD2052]UPW19585.1 hypothetical protein M0C34_04720 [Agarivorans sp. TSD2052]